ncbi:MAG: tyrosine--tRNA ligase, partial [Actinobacteria bacterium]|nr:tyrosine--tRNA ligase [Actinomycetota bacterium]
NLLMGRELQKEYGQKPQIAITMPILVGLDGVNKMSKSLGNYIGVSEPPNEIFGKVMSIPDSIMIDYFNLLTRLTKDEISKIKENIENGDLNPSIAKRKLAVNIIENLYDHASAENAEINFNRIFKDKEAPEQIDEFIIYKKDYLSGKIRAVSLLTSSRLCSSNNDAKRVVEQGGLKIGGNKVTDMNTELNLEEINSQIIQKGRRYFLKIIVK